MFLGKNWSWAKILEVLNDDNEIQKITIITYNYDVFLERILKLLNIEYSVLNDDKKFTIIKPHGSISFCSKTKMQDAPVIRYSEDFTRGKICDLQVYYDERMAQANAMNTIIPPASDSNRDFEGWAASFRKQAIDAAKELKHGDIIVICGISYQHVDRHEIDRILLNAGKSSNEELHVIQVNPNPSSALNSVLSCLFDHILGNYILNFPHTLIT